MKRCFACFVLVIWLLAAALPAAAEYDPEVDYMERMITAAQCGDTEAGEEAQARRDEKIAALELDLPGVDYGELSLLSRLIYSEAGSDWLDEHWKMAVGEVVLNRMASPEFPDTMREVIDQRGQYSRAVNYVLPNYASVIAAKKLLEGERVLENPAVVFQSNARLGSGVFLELKDEYLGSTYLCYSSHMELYES